MSFKGCHQVEERNVGFELAELCYILKRKAEELSFVLVRLSFEDITQYLGKMVFIDTL